MQERVFFELWFAGHSQIQFQENKGKRTQPENLTELLDTFEECRKCTENVRKLIKTHTYTQQHMTGLI
jgi:hypothetical protein